MIFTAALCLAFSPAHLVKEEVPALGKVAGIVIGVTTLPDYEARHGKGFTEKWGLGAGKVHYWYDATSGAVISTDGVFATKEGQVIDGLDIEWVGKGKNSFARKFDASGTHPAYKASLPVIHLSPDELGELAKFHQGETRGQIDATAGLLLPNENSFLAKGRVDYGSRLRYVGDRTEPWISTGYDLWTLGFVFDHDKSC